ncbi:MAG: histidine phosphatase family protein [Thermoanaerobaculia bacterium]
MKPAGSKAPARGVLLLLAFALAPAAAPAQKAVVVVRHAEKQSAESGPGVPLSEAGKARAARLAAMLGDAGVTAIFATDTVRARSTATPLAEALNKPIRIYSDVPALAEALRRDPDAVALVVGHSNTVPALLAALGVKEKITLTDADYDNLLLVVPKPSGEPVFLRLRY